MIGFESCFFDIVDESFPSPSGEKCSIWCGLRHIFFPPESALCDGFAGWIAPRHDEQFVILICYVNRENTGSRDLQVAILEYLSASGRLRVRPDGTLLPLPGMQAAEEDTPQETESNQINS